MDILILGGTGAMGVPLIEQLSNNTDIHLYVTSRSERRSSERITYIQGNAKDYVFFSSLMEREYAAVIDFMVYNTAQLEQRLPILLKRTEQYFFFSSSRCYANSITPITEDSPRLVDVCDDLEYLSLDEYGLAKGREENLIMKSGYRNWTIIRPYITYNSYRMQLGVFEKENWLKRALDGRTIVFPKDIAAKRTSLTYGPDVAGAVVSLIGNPKALGQAFHITTTESHTWGEILAFYCNVIGKKTGVIPKVKFVDDSCDLQKVWNKWQIRYDRLYDRTFNNSKIESIQGRYEYKATFEGLEECLNSFMEDPIWLKMNWRYEAWCDRITGEMTPLSQIPGLKDKLKYIKYRFF